jgi:hypothetical protein
MPPCVDKGPRLPDPPSAPIRPDPMADAQGVNESGHVMYVKELKERVEHDAYVVDAHLVAEAMMQRVAARRADTPTLTRRGARDRAAAAPSPRRPA